jgi:2-dehydropantoate 2-reductase
MMSAFKKIYVLGAGAVGCFFGGILARAGCDVTLIARPDRAQAINEFGLELDCKTFQEVVRIKASSDLTLLADADLILLSVKSPDTEKLVREISSIVPSQAAILSLQNGVANVQLANKCIANPVYPAVVYVATGMDGHRTMRHHGRGELLVGAMDNMTDRDSKNLTLICQLFEGASIPCVISDDIKKQMWLKFLVNCSYNGISAIGHMSYGEMVAIPEVKELIDQITKEFLAITLLEGVRISEAEAKEANELIATTMVTQISSTAQDLSKGKKTEIDYLNGYIVELGRQYGVPTPFNQSVYAMVKMLENKIVQYKH